MVALAYGGGLSAQTPPQPPGAPRLTLDTGRQIFEGACIGCHGPGATGQPLSTLGFEPPATFPDFSDCNGSTRERTFDWRATIHEGGPGRGFSEIMPSFADALTLEQIDTVMAYLREQCPDPAWPLGELNLPRALFTEKAFPEDEWVLTTAANTNRDGGVSSAIIYEKRFGVRNQLELVAPFSAVQQGRTWNAGVGDLVAGYKRVLFSSLPAGSIVSAVGEFAVPTGHAERGLGLGVPKVETFAALGQILPRLSFIQFQAGGELPTDPARAPRAAFGRLAFGKSFAGNQGFGRLWTPIVEVLVDREFSPDAHTSWDIAPQFQVSLNRRQHIRVNVGVKHPVRNTDGRSTQVVFYALWDFFDGGLRDGW
ncbi:MAG: cytochrome c [Acidobacteria bacterium]|nr:cytochrome c [Acidobacteriota bacterium]